VILIESPAYWAAAPNPMVVTGTANTFEATVHLSLLDAEGELLWEGFTTAECGSGCRGAWETTIPYQVDEDQYGTLVAWETSADDGSQINTREHSVYLIAG